MGACTIPGNLMIVTELMPQNLDTFFLSNNTNRKKLTLIQKLKMARDAALGIPCVNVLDIFTDHPLSNPYRHELAT